VLEKAMPVFWKHGFADTSLQELERATGVNKSGLYTEFRDKEDLFVACLRHYLESQGKRGLLTKEPLGWKNVETFLKNGPLNKGEQQGCFSVNSMREFAILPDEAYGVVTENRALLQRLLGMNIEAESPRWLLLQLPRLCCPSSPDCALNGTSNQLELRRPARSRTL
jgi:TetR/AcrR family transcriptional regulator, copper-responsive repressor